MQLQPWPVDDFSGGITDDYLNCKDNQFKRGENFLIMENRELMSRPGSALVSTTHYLPGFRIANERTDLLFDLNGVIFELQDDRIFYNSGAGYAELKGPYANNALVSGYKYHFQKWGDHILITGSGGGAASPPGTPSPQIIYKNSAGNFQIRSAGLPYLENEPTITPGAGANTYIYAFVYYYTYTLFDLTQFEQYGPVTYVTKSSAAAPNVTPIAITNIPEYDPATSFPRFWRNVDYVGSPTSLKVRIYRSVAGGSVLKYVGEIQNGVNTYNDTKADTALGQDLYTTGGVLDYDPAPDAKYAVVVNDFAYYGNIGYIFDPVTGSGTGPFPKKIRQSNAGALGHCPLDFEVDLEFEVTGLGSVGNYPVAFSENRVYRLENHFDELGRGFIERIEISRTTGCISHKSIVPVLGGLYFAGSSGFFWTDGFKVYPISSDMPSHYGAMVANCTDVENIYGVYHEQEQRVYWAVQFDSSSGDNDGFYVIHEKFGLIPQMPTTTFQGGESFAPSALLVYNDRLYRADKRGYLFLHSPAVPAAITSQVATDPKIDLLYSPSDWLVQPVIYDYISKAFPLGSKSVRKWVTRMSLFAKNGQNVSAGIFSINDDSGVAKELRPILGDDSFRWGTGHLHWGDPTCLWNHQSVVRGMRRFPKRGLRCDYKQVQLTNAWIAIYNSDTFGLGNIEGGFKTISLVNYPAQVWPDDVVDYSIAFEADSYTREYLIISRTDQTLIYLDVAGNSVSASSSKWVIRGYRKGDILPLIHYTLWYGYLTPTQTPYRRSASGENL